MLSKNLLEALNDQMNHEYFAAHAYMAMAAYCDKESYEGFANFFIQQAKEERFHGQKIYNYINDRGAHAESEQFQHQKLTFQAY
ncbi:ferritin [Staphylococcus aureus]|uniref:Ferritin n=1 Tax=Staphylococcus aureus TaxID=1280 RepID=A0A2X2JZ99_STAAU|nr:ferritin [Staphylococcus aureus]